jgi:predicted alpha/beta-hydrolase family hydrolase
MHLDIETSAGVGWAELDVPTKPTALLALTHGAGVGVGTVDLAAVRDAALAEHIAVALLTQPFRVKGSLAGKAGAPPKPEPQDVAWRELVTGVRGQRTIAKLPLVLGGRSNGARVACRTAKDLGAAAVVALAYPLHPPGKPEKSRLDELEATGLPTLVVQGERDAFGMPPTSPKWKRVVVAGDHGLKKDPAAVASAVVEFVLATVA